MKIGKNRKTTISLDRHEHICELADSIGEMYASSNGTDLESLLKHNDLSLYYDTFDEPFDGLIEAYDGIFNIYCNTKTGNTPDSLRTRFTIAHELGHYFIDEHRNALIKDLMPSLGEHAPKDLVVEREADLFASRLLLPGTLFIRSLRKVEPGLKGAVALAKRFNVSIKCAVIRYLSTDKYSCSLAFWSFEGDLIWKCFSRSMWNAGIRKLKPTPIKGGATHICLSKKPEGIESTSATVGYAFQTGDGAHYHSIVQEDAIVLGDYGVLSLIWTTSGNLESMAAVIDKRLERASEF